MRRRYNRAGIPARAAALLCVLLIILLAGCQPTPETAVVINKNSAPEATGNASGEAGESFSAPETWTDSLDYAGGRVTVNINADVVCKTGVYKQYEIQPLEFTQAQAEKCVEVFFSSAPLEANGQRWTKAQYEEFLIGFKKQYATGNETGMSEEEYNASVKELERRLANAPETAEVLNPQEQIKAFSKTGSLRLRADLGRAERAELTVTNADEGFASSVGFSNNDGDGYSPMHTDERPAVSEDTPGRRRSDCSLNWALIIWTLPLSRPALCWAAASLTRRIPRASPYAGSSILRARWTAYPRHTTLRTERREKRTSMSGRGRTRG